MANFLSQFNKFLLGIDLKAYRKKYMPIKIVEMNMPPNTQALSTVYRVYWDEKRLLSFDDFYKEYLSDHKSALKDFYKKTFMCRACFRKGLEARIYRTWASIITQIHAGYVAEQVFGPKTVKMSEQLDHQDADIRVEYKGYVLNYDVKKIANAGVMGRGHTPKRSIPGEKIQIRYEVPSMDIILNPKKKNGTGFKKAYLDFANKYLETKMLEVFPNGFVVFDSQVFEKKKKEIDQKSK